MSVQIKEFTKNLAKSRDLRLSVVFNNKAVETSPLFLLLTCRVTVL